MKLFKTLFGKKEEAPLRDLSHPRQLRQGDLMKVSDSFALPRQLRDQSFQVLSVTTYQYEHDYYAECTLKGSDDEVVYFSVDDEDDEENACFSRRLERAEVERIFQMEEFARLFDADSHAELSTAEVPEAYDGWVAPHYRQTVIGERGFFHDTDFAGQRPPETAGEGQAFDRYEAVSDDGSHGLEIEVWESGETDVFISLYRPLTDIRELWPGAG